MEKEAKLYEIGYLLNPLIPEDKLDDEISSLRKKIEDKKGFIMNEARPKMQRLAYPIKKNEAAFFGWIKFMIEPSALLEFKKTLEGQSADAEKIIRFLIIKAVKESMIPKPAKRIIRKKKEVLPGTTERPEIKIEEIDKKIEELLEAQ